MRTGTVVGSLLLAFCLAACGGADPPAESAPSGTTAPPTPAAPAKAAPSPPRQVDPELFEAVEADPQDLAARRHLAIALHDAKRTDEALAQFEKLAELSPSVRHLLDLALAYTASSRLPEAEDIYLRILATVPDHHIALHNLGNIAMLDGRTELAIERYRAAITAKPDYLLAHYHLGDALQRNEQYREAYATYQHVLTLDPTDPMEIEALDDSLYQIGMLDLEMGAHERAAEMLRGLIRAVPDHPNAHYAYGRALMLLGHEEEAQAEFDTHVELMARQEPSGPVATGD